MKLSKFDLLVIGLTVVFIASCVGYYYTLTMSGKVSYEFDQGDSSVYQANSQKIQNQNITININTASITELTTLPKIGPEMAKRIVEYRSRKSFRSIQDIMNVKGIGEATFNAIKNNITV